MLVPTQVTIAQTYPANSHAVNVMLKKPIDESPSADYGRSGWCWIRLMNGDLILGFYPLGDAYFEVEEEVEKDYEAAIKADAITRSVLTDLDIRDQEK